MSGLAIDVPSFTAKLLRVFDRQKNRKVVSRNCRSLHNALLRDSLIVKIEAHGLFKSVFLTLKNKIKNKAIFKRRQKESPLIMPEGTALYLPGLFA